MTTKEESLLRMEAVVKRTERFLPFFEAELYKEWSEILRKKIEAYVLQAGKAPRVGDIVYAKQVVIVGEQKNEVQVPFKVSKDEQDEYVSEYKHKIDELQAILDMPRLMKSDAERMKAQVEKFKKEGKETTR